MKKRLICILITMITVFMSGCWDSREINTIAITICIGIDKTKDGLLLTEQVLNPKAIASKNALNESPVVIFSEKGKDIFEIVRKMNIQTSRKIYNSQLRVIVFGEGFAKKGIKDVLDFFARDHEFRTDFYFVVAKGTTANKVLNVLTPLETIPRIKMYNSLKTSEDSWAPTKAIRIIELINSIIAKGKNPVLTGVEITRGKNTTNSTEDLKQVNPKNRLKFSNLGVFKKDKLKGWLSEGESKGYNYIMGSVKSTVGHIKYKNQKVTFEVIGEKTKMKVYMIKGKPAIDVKIYIEQNVGSVTGKVDILKEEVEKTLDTLIEDKIKSFCYRSIKKAKFSFKSDIFGFGEAIHRAYPRVWAKIQDNWDNEFIKLPVTVNVKAKMNGLGQITEPLFKK